MLVGGMAGAVIVGPLTGWVTEWTGRAPEGLAALLPVLLGALVGSFLGAAAATWVGFRDEDRRARAISTGSVIVLGPLLFIGGWAVLEPLEIDALAPQVVLAAALAVAAVAGRWVATRDHATRDEGRR